LNDLIDKKLNGTKRKKELKALVADIKLRGTSKWVKYNYDLNFFFIKLMNYFDIPRIYITAIGFILTIL